MHACHPFAAFRQAPSVAKGPKLRPPSILIPTISDRDSMRAQYIRILLLGLSFPFACLDLQAQVIPGGRPTEAQCRAARQALAAERHNTTALETLPSCVR